MDIKGYIAQSCDPAIPRFLGEGPALPGVDGPDTGVACFESNSQLLSGSAPARQGRSSGVPLHGGFKTVGDLLIEGRTNPDRGAVTEFSPGVTPVTPGPGHTNPRPRRRSHLLPNNRGFLGGRGASIVRRMCDRLRGRPDWEPRSRGHQSDHRAIFYDPSGVGIGFASGY